MKVLLRGVGFGALLMTLLVWRLETALVFGDRGRRLRGGAPGMGTLLCGERSWCFAIADVVSCRGRDVDQEQ